MKVLQTICAVVLGFSSLTSFAQDETTVLKSKRGEAILPQAGDVTMAVEATPALDYVGNMFSGSTEKNTLSSDTPIGLHFRYYLQDNAALRLKVRIDNSTRNNKYYIQDDAAKTLDPMTDAEVQDLEVRKERNVEFNLAYLIIKGESRLRGYYGPEVGFSRGTINKEYTYGNAITAQNTNPTTINFGSNIVNPGRLTEIDGGDYHSFSIGGVAGVEYYILPKFAIGGEVSLRYQYTSVGQSFANTEYWSGAAVEMKEDTYTPSTHHTDLNGSTEDFYAGLYLMFTF